MMDVFKMIDLVKCSTLLALNFRSVHEVFICQKKYDEEILINFKMEECKSTTTFMNQKEKFCNDDGAE